MVRFYLSLVIMVRVKPYDMDTWVVAFHPRFVFLFGGGQAVVGVAHGGTCPSFAYTYLHPHVERDVAVVH